MGSERAVPVNEILVGDALGQLQQLPAESVHCVVTSPPYWGLRDYAVDGQIGLEASPEEYIEKLVAIFREVRRVLRHDGTLWVNMGDCYTDAGPLDGTRHNLRPKNLIGQPWRLAFALQSDGWWLRSDIIWAKPNPMPESVTDRPTKAHEYVFLLSKSERYFYDTEAVRELALTGNHHRNVTEPLKYGRLPAPDGNRPHRGLWKTAPPEAGRNLRTVWTIVTQPFPEAHFATFPEALPSRCILAGTSERGACAQCGAPLRRIMEVPKGHPTRTGEKGVDARQSRRKNIAGSAWAAWKAEHPNTTKGWEPTCSCENPAATVPCIVLDPFMGAGTVALVALKAGRHFVGIELNPKYAEMARRRIEPELVQGRLA